MEKYTMKNNREPKTDNGWFHIDDVKPNSEEEVIVILERESSLGCTYDFNICESTYRCGCCNGYFLKENSVWKVRYWRRKESYPYPDGVVKKEIEECKKYNVSSQKILEHQQKCGIDASRYQ